MVHTPLATVSVWYQHLLSLFQCGFRMPCHYFSVVSTSFVAVSACIPIHCHCFSVVPVSFVTVSVWYPYLLLLFQCAPHPFSLFQCAPHPLSLFQYAISIVCHCFSVASRSFVTVSVWYFDLCHCFSIFRSLSLFQCGISILCHRLSVVSRSLSLF